MRFYFNIAKTIYMYWCTIIMTMAMVIWVGFYIQDLIENRMPQDTPAMKCIEDGGTWDDTSGECKSAA